MYTYIVFDLDETIGYFTQFGIIWDSIESIFDENLSQETFNCILSLYPNYFRYGIFAIFQYLKNVKKRNKNLKVILYTNNQGSKKWSNFIVNYIEEKINYKLFDQLIYAYKINGKQIESKRTTHNKTFGDFRRCTNCKKYERICFIDDQFHPGMKQNNIYYINIKPYYYYYEIDKIVNTFISSNCYKNICSSLKFKCNDEVDKKKMKNIILSYNILDGTQDQLTKEKTLTKKLLFHLQKFIRLHARKTKKRSRSKHKKTQKNIN